MQRELKWIQSVVDVRACGYESSSRRGGSCFCTYSHINDPSALCGPSLGHKHHSGCVVVQLCSGESFM